MRQFSLQEVPHNIHHHVVHLEPPKDPQQGILFNSIIAGTHK